MTLLEHIDAIKEILRAREDERSERILRALANAKAGSALTDVEREKLAEAEQNISAGNFIVNEAFRLKIARMGIAEIAERHSGCAATVKVAKDIDAHIRAAVDYIQDRRFYVPPSDV